MMKPEAFAQAIREAQQQVAHYEQLSRMPMGHGAHGPLRCARIALAALMLCQEYQVEALVLAKVGQ